MLKKKNQALKKGYKRRLFLSVSYILVLVVSLLATIVPHTVRALDCNALPADRCEEVIARCIELNGTWNAVTAQCDGEQAVDTAGECATAGGSWKEIRTNRPGVPDGIVYRCDCPTGQEMTNNKCQTPPLATTDPGSTTAPDYKENDCTGPDIQAGLPKDDKNHCGILDYIVVTINVLSLMSGVVIIAMIVVGGLQYATGFGATDKDPMAVGAAKHKISNAVLALFVYTFFYAFLNWVVPGGLL